MNISGESGRTFHKQYCQDRRERDRKTTRRLHIHNRTFSLRRGNSVQFSKHNHCHSTKPSKSPTVPVHAKPEKGWGTAHRVSAFLWVWQRQELPPWCNFPVIAVRKRPCHDLQHRWFFSLINSWEKKIHWVLLTAKFLYPHQNVSKPAVTRSRKDGQRSTNYFVFVLFTPPPATGQWHSPRSPALLPLVFFQKYCYLSKKLEFYKSHNCLHAGMAFRSGHNNIAV